MERSSDYRAVAALAHSAAAAAEIAALERGQCVADAAYAYNEAWSIAMQAYDPSVPPAAPARPTDVRSLYLAQLEREADAALADQRAAERRHVAKMASYAVLPGKLARPPGGGCFDPTECQVMVARRAAEVAWARLCRADERLARRGRR